MKLNLTRGESFIFGVAAASFAASLVAYLYLPERLAVHWNASGTADGYSGKFFGAFLIPCISLVLAVVLSIIPRIEPNSKSIDSFRGHYEAFAITLALFIAGLHLQLSLLWNLGVQISPALTIPLGLAILFFKLGEMLEKSQRNYFIGVRTPWTLASEPVWKKTNSLAGKLFKFAAIPLLAAAFLPQYGIYLLLVVVALLAMSLVGYSFVEYSKEKKR